MGIGDFDITWLRLVTEISLQICLVTNLLPQNFKMNVFNRLVLYEQTVEDVDLKILRQRIRREHDQYMLTIYAPYRITYKYTGTTKSNIFQENINL